jgi:hypothetical protein
MNSTMKMWFAGTAHASPLPLSQSKVPAKTKHYSRGVILDIVIGEKDMAKQQAGKNTSKRNVIGNRYGSSVACIPIPETRGESLESDAEVIVRFRGRDIGGYRPLEYNHPPRGVVC